MIDTNKIYAATSLMDEEIPELKHWVDDLVVPGLTLFAAAPKTGKSYLMLYLCYCISIGQAAFNKRRTKQGKVLYMALEDNKRRMQKRLGEIMQANVLSGFQKPDNLHIYSEVGLNKKNRFNALKHLIKENDYDVVVIDILEKIRKTNESKTYSNEYKLLESLKKVADATDTAIIAVHHTNKSQSKDPLNMVSGTQGLAGAADNIMVMTKCDMLAVLNVNGLLVEIQGRDLERQTFRLAYGEGTPFYQQLDATPTDRSKQAKIDKAWELYQEHGYTQEEIAEQLGHQQPYICKLLKQKREQLKNKDKD